MAHRAMTADGARPFETFDDPAPAVRLLPCPAEGREIVLASGSSSGVQIKRVGEGRWTPAKEKRFFDELAATANVRRAAAAAGVSANAVYARRMKQAHFRAKWAAVLDSGRAAIEMKLVEAANKSFDADDLDTGDVEPRVSVTEAIRIVQLHGSKAQKESVEIEPEQTMDDIDALREGILHGSPRWPRANGRDWRWKAGPTTRSAG